MAEATLIIAGGNKRHEPVSKIVDSKQLEQNKIVLTDQNHSGTRTLISCGQTLPDQIIKIVNPETLTPCDPEEIGEIWVSGASVAHGYWNKAQVSEHTFQANLCGQTDTRFLRTGDLGCMIQAELFVTGRLKDLIIINGRNHYPQDLERTVEASSEFLRTGGTASFVVNDESKEKLVILSEVERRYWNPRSKQRANQSNGESPQLPDLKQLIRRQIVQHHDLQTHNILLLKPGSIPKTSSGKIQRHVCRNIYLAEDFAALTI